MTAHKIDAGALLEQGDRAYAVSQLENDPEVVPLCADDPGAGLVALWRLYRATAATVMGATLVRTGDALRFAR